MQLTYNQAMIVYVLLIDKRGQENLSEDEQILLMAVNGFLDQESINNNL